MPPVQSCLLRISNLPIKVLQAKFMQSAEDRNAVLLSVRQHRNTLCTYPTVNIGSQHNQAQQRQHDQRQQPELQVLRLPRERRSSPRLWVCVAYSKFIVARIINCCVTESRPPWMRRRWSSWSNHCSLPRDGIYAPFLVFIDLSFYYLSTCVLTRQCPS
jgi:hypothetical protein